MSDKTQQKFLRLSIRPWGFITAAGIVACAATLFGFLGRFSWFLDLFSHFRVQYVFGLGVLGLLLLARKRRRMAILFLAFSAINLGTVLPLFFGGSSQPPRAARPLRALLLNVNTRHGDVKRVKKVVQDFDPDLVVLEEISSQWVRDLKWLTKSHQHCRIQPREDNFGIGLFSKLPLAESAIVYIGDAGVPSIIARIDTDDGAFSVIATHPLPPGGARYSHWRNDQLDKITSFLPSSLPLLLLGDLNTTPWSYHFTRLLKRTGLKDSCQGRGVQPTWPSHNPLLLIPIDHCLHSDGIVVVAKKIGPNVGSDHYPVIVDFVINSVVRNTP